MWLGFFSCPPPEAAQHGSDSRLAAGVILALDLDEFDATCCVAELSALVRQLFEASPCRVVCALTFASGSRHLATLHQESYQHRESDRRRGSRGPCLFGPVCCCSHFAATPQAGVGNANAGVGASMAALLSAPAKRPPVDVAKRMAALGLEDMGQAAWPSSTLVEILVEVLGFS